MDISEEYINQVIALYPNLPVFLVGESMGGTMSILLSFRLKHLITGMILMSPGIGMPVQFESCLSKLIKCVTWMFPSFSLDRK